MTNTQTPATDPQIPVAEAKTLTYGQKAVGLKFNPSGDARVQKIKELYAEIIDIMDDYRNAESTIDKQSWEHRRLSSVAITEAQSAQMRAVKALTWTDEI